MKIEEISDFDALLNRVEILFEPAEMRRFASSVLRLADAIDQEWSPEKVKSRFSRFTKAGRIERNALELAKVAQREAHRAKLRERHINSDLFGEPAWNILLELFQQFAGGSRVSTKSLQLISGCPETTALRVIDRLESSGLVERGECETDKRVTLIGLTQKGVEKVGLALMEMSG